MPELKVSDEELQSLLVEQLGVIDRADFDRASKLAQRLRTPLIHTLVEQGRIPQTFLLEQLARSWKVGFVNLTIGHVKGDIICALQETFSRKHNSRSIRPRGRSAARRHGGPSRTKRCE